MNINKADAALQRMKVALIEVEAGIADLEKLDREDHKAFYRGGYCSKAYDAQLQIAPLIRRLNQIFRT
jgi:hypothetical protein